MNSIVYSYPIPGDGIVKLPAGAQVLSAGFGGTNPDVLRIWALVNPEEGCRVERRFAVVGTGQQVPKWLPLKFINTAFA